MRNFLTQQRTRPEIRIFVPPFGLGMQRFAIVAAGLTLALLWINAVWKGIWDWLLISGWFALILGLWLAHGIPDKLEYTLDRLANRGALAVTPERLYSFKQELETRVVKYWALGGGSTVALAILMAFVFAFPGREIYLRIPLTLAEMLGGYIAGCYLGRMACYGTLGSSLKSTGMELWVIAGHPDSVGGLKPVGDFYFYQAMVVAIPAIFLAIWLLLIPLPYFHLLYYHWQRAYAGLLALAIVFEMLAFLIPLRSFHCEMERQKRILLQEADKLSPEIAEIQRKLAEGQPGDEAKVLRDSLADKTARYWAIEQLPAWPIDLRTKGLFSLNTVALLLPLISEYTGLSKQWAEFLKTMLGAA
jgi:hypothetical protein